MLTEAVENLAEAWEWIVNTAKVALKKLGSSDFDRTSTNIQTFLRSFPRHVGALKKFLIRKP